MEDESTKRRRWRNLKYLFLLLASGARDDANDTKEQCVAGEEHENLRDGGRRRREGRERRAAEKGGREEGRNGRDVVGRREGGREGAGQYIEN
jgi:hypothetical protein